jgi:hypothetical protein
VIKARSPQLVEQIYGVPHVILQEFINVLYEHVFQDPQISHRTVKFIPQHSTLAPLKPINGNEFKVDPLQGFTF